MPPERIVRERKLRAWSQEQLAVHAGVSRNTVARIETGQSVQRGSYALVLRVLDLDEIGPGAGLSEKEFLREFRRRFPHVDLSELVNPTEPTPPPPDTPGDGETHTGEPGKDATRPA